MSAPDQEIATRAFAVEALATALAQAVRYALAAKLDQSVVSELKHLQGVVEFNKFVENEMVECSSEGDKISKDGLVRLGRDGIVSVRIKTSDYPKLQGVVGANREAEK